MEGFFLADLPDALDQIQVVLVDGLLRSRCRRMILSLKPKTHAQS